MPLLNGLDRSVISDVDCVALTDLPHSPQGSLLFLDGPAHKLEREPLATYAARLPAGRNVQEQEPGQSDRFSLLGPRLIDFRFGSQFPKSGPINGFAAWQCSRFTQKPI